MKIQHINSQQFNTCRENQRQNQQPAFGGILDGMLNGGTQLLRFLNTNQAWGATAVDFTCMVAPRTITDFSRGADAGVETLRREASGTVNHASVGLIYAPLAGFLLSSMINSDYGIKAQKVFADSDAVDIMSKMQFDSLRANGGIANVDDYAAKVAASITNANGTNLSDDAQKAFARTLVNEVSTSSKDNRAMLRHIVLEDLGSESDIMMKATGKEVKASLNDVVDNVISMSKTLFKDKVINSFKEATNFADVKFVKSLKNFGMRRSLLGLALASVIGCSIQPINIYLTKKKTGSDGFVGVEGREKDKSFGFKVKKALTASAFGAGVYALMDKPFLKGIQYKGLTPTLNQFKLVYGLTIMSRFLATRDSDELREATVKDTLGFLSWLVLGNFIQKGTQKGLSALYNRRNNANINVVGKTRDEILYAALKKAGIPLIENGKPLTFMQMMKKLPKTDKLARTKLRYLTIAQLAGYAFSGVVLGVGIPKLNIYMTNKSEAKRKAKLAQLQTPVSNMLKPENLAFLNNFTSSKMLND